MSYRARFNNNPETLLVELVCSIDERLEHLERLVHRLIRKPYSITFKEMTMNPTEAGQTQVFTGTLAPAGAVFPPDSVCRHIERFRRLALRGPYRACRQRHLSAGLERERNHALGVQLHGDERKHRHEPGGDYHTFCAGCGANRYHIRTNSVNFGCLVRPRLRLGLFS